MCQSRSNWLQYGVLIATIFVSGITYASSHDEIVITNGHWPPYQSQSLPHYGFVSMLVTEAFAVEGITVHYRFRPWKRAFEEAKSGAAHATMIWSKTKERKPFFYFSDSIVTSQAVLFHNKSLKFEWHTFGDLVHYRIGGTLGYEYKIQEWPELKIHRTNTDEQNLRMLALGRIDLFPCDLQACLVLLNDKIEASVSSQLRYNPKPYDETKYYVLFSRKREENPYFVERFNRGLKTLKQSGRYDEIVNAQKKGKLQDLRIQAPLHPAL